MNTAAVSSSAIVEKKTWSYLRPGSCCAARVEAGAGADAIVAKVFSGGHHLMVLTQTGTMPRMSFPYHLAIPATGIILAVLGAIVRKLQRRNSDQWPIVEAHVFQTVTDHNSQATWICRVVYSYSVSGDY